VVEAINVISMRQKNGKIRGGIVGVNFWVTIGAPSTSGAAAGVGGTESAVGQITQNSYLELLVTGFGFQFTHSVRPR
jgi:hypothetical protein